MEEAVRRRDHPSHAIHRGNRVSVNGSAVCPRTAVRVVVVDDHAAIRMGLRAAIDSRPPLVCVGVAADGEQLAPLLYRTRPDVVILDYDLPRANGLELCRRVKADVPAPAVLLYSAYADAALALAGIVAGADGIVHKGSPAREVLEAIQAVAAGGTHLPPPLPELMQGALDSVDPGDRALLAMLLERTPSRTIAGALQLPACELEERVARVLARVEAPRRAPSPASGR
jgi:DNA-binding NarL/FixJ family response regulator